MVQIKGLTLVVDCTDARCQGTGSGQEVSRHKTYKVLLVYHLRAHLVIACPESSPDVLVIKNLHLEAKVLFQVLDEHDKERQLDAERLLRVARASHVGCANISAHNLKYTRANVVVGNPLDVAISNCTALDCGSTPGAHRSCTAITPQITIAYLACPIFAEACYLYCIGWTRTPTETCS